jgi:hypothetical protein
MAMKFLLVLMVLSGRVGCEVYMSEWSKFYNHPDKPGAGAKKRKKLKGKDKVHVVMGEFKRGTLRSGSGKKVAKRKQAVAIALSEARKKRG